MINMEVVWEQAKKDIEDQGNEAVIRNNILADFIVDTFAAFAKGDIRRQDDN